MATRGEEIGLVSGVICGTTAMDWMKLNKPTAQISCYDTLAIVLETLEEGTIDVHTHWPITVLFLFFCRRQLGTL